MKTAILCPGQGSQAVGMGADLVASLPAARAVYDEADEILDWSVAQLCFEGSAERLSDTRYTQPALYVHSCAAGRVLLERGVQPTYFAGHSLGEYSALALGGSFSFADGLRLVVTRALAMADAATANAGTMAAIVGLDEKVVVDAIDGISGVVPANLNAPDQVVISGTVAGVDAASKALANLGAKRIVPLAVSGAFHSPLMEPAAEALREAVASVRLRPPSAPLVANVTARPTTDPEEIADLLCRQITSPVRWTDSIRTLVQAGVTSGLEVGPGRVLQGLARRIDRRLTVSGAGTADELSGLQIE